MVFITHCLTTQIDAICCRLEQLTLQNDVARTPITIPPTTGPTSIQEGKPNIFIFIILRQTEIAFTTKNLLGPKYDFR